MKVINKSSFISDSPEKTRKFAEKFAKEILHKKIGSRAAVLALKGNLGAGKTTFLQGFAKGLGIKDKILSPTFVIYKKFKIPKTDKYFYHFDCYRIKESKEILALGFEEIILNPKNIVALEWPERAKDILPPGSAELRFGLIGENKIEISLPAGGL